MSMRTARHKLAGMILGPILLGVALASVPDPTAANAIYCSEIGCGGSEHCHGEATAGTACNRDCFELNELTDEVIVSGSLECDPIE